MQSKSYVPIWSKIKLLFMDYLPDLAVISGVSILSYNVFRPPEDRFGLDLVDLTDYHIEYKVIGVLLITVGLDIAIRRYLKNKSQPSK